MDGKPPDHARFGERQKRYAPADPSPSIPLAPLISSPQNRRVVQARKLKLRKHRRRQGRFLVEGPRLLETMIEAGSPPLEVFALPEWIEADGAGAGLSRRAQDLGAEVVPVTPTVLRELCDTETPQGVVATAAMTPAQIDDLRKIEAPLILGLQQLRDPGNVGTLLRTAAAFGVTAVAVDRGNVDVYNPKVVRSGMGAHFHLPLVSVRDWSVAVSEWMSLWSRNGDCPLQVIGATVHGGTDCGAVDWMAPTLLLLGNETTGLAPEVEQTCTSLVHIPIVHLESLNVSVAGSILLYEAMRARHRGASR